MTDRMVDLTEEGFDAAIRVGDIPDSRIVAKHLGIIRPVIIASPVYLKRYGEPKTPDELDQHNGLAIRFPRTGRLGEWRFVEDGRPRKVPVTGNMVFDIGEALVDLAVLGHGIVQTQRLMAMQALANKQVVALLEDYVASGRPISLIYPQSRQLSPKIRVLNKALANLSF